MSETENGSIAQFSFRGPTELHQEVHAAAASESMSFAEFCRRALWERLANPAPQMAERVENLEARLAELEASRGMAPAAEQPW